MPAQLLPGPLHGGARRLCQATGLIRTPVLSLDPSPFVFLMVTSVLQVKCPECRAEHRIPYNGIQGFPTNYTLQKFLELHSEITGNN